MKQSQLAALESLAEDEALSPVSGAADEFDFDPAEIAKAAAKLNSDVNVREFVPKPKQVLTGVAAMKFLGLRAAPFYQLKGGVSGSYQVIYDKFERLFKRWQKLKGEDAITADVAFWSRIKLRVWRLDSIEDNGFSADGKTILGKPTSPIGLKYAKNADAAARYEGFVVDGTHMSSFLPNLPPHQTNAYQQYFVQLISVDVTEDMLNYA